MPETQPAQLFSFGTLTQPQVQHALFGGPVPSQPASLPGHGLVYVPITDPDVIRLSGTAEHRGLARRVEEAVQGHVLTLSTEQLAAADAYEVDAYVRRRVQLTTIGPGDEPRTGTAWAYVAADPLTAAERIAVVGDSIAFGLDDPDGGWAGHLTRQHSNTYGRRVWNLAVPGLTLRQLTHHIDAETALRRVDTVVIAAGINDLAADHGPAHPAELVTMMDAMCTRLEGVGRRPVVLTPVWLDVKRASEQFSMQVRLQDAANYRDRLICWATQTHRDVIDLWPVLEGRTDRFTDGVHPDAEGHAQLWKRMAPNPTAR